MQAYKFKPVARMRALRGAPILIIDYFLRNKVRDIDERDAHPRWRLINSFPRLVGFVIAERRASTFLPLPILNHYIFSLLSLFFSFFLYLFLPSYFRKETSYKRLQCEGPFWQTTCFSRDLQWAKRGRIINNPIVDQDYTYVHSLSIYFMHFYRRLSSAPLAESCRGDKWCRESGISPFAPRGCETLCTRTLFVERSACMHACACTAIFLPTYLLVNR